MIPTGTPSNPAELCKCHHLTSAHRPLPRIHPSYHPDLRVCSYHGCTCRLTNPPETAAAKGLPQ